MGLTYAGANNPKKYNGTEDYSSKPVHREDIPAYTHDLEYGKLNIRGANGLLNDPKAIPADLKFAGHEFYINITSFNPVVRFALLW